MMSQLRTRGAGRLKPYVGVDGMVTLKLVYDEPESGGTISAELPADYWWAMSKQVGDMLKAAGYPPPEEATGD